MGFDVIAVHCKRSHAIFWRCSTVFYRLCGVVLYWLLFWARIWGALPNRSVVTRRVTSLTNHNDLSMDAFCVSLVQRTEARLGLRVCHFSKSYCWVLPCMLGLCRSTCCAQLCSFRV